VKIYTKRGDAGRTSLFDGTDVAKNDPRVDAYGDVDELNAAIGAARAFLSDRDVDGVLLGIQNDLFAVGAQLADPKYDPSRRKAKTLITEPKIEAFEKHIDRWEEKLAPLKGFILPAGSPGGAMLHLARCICRRAERRIVDLSAKVGVPPIVIKYMNRLSDLLFVMARVENKARGDQEVDW